MSAGRPAVPQRRSVLEKWKCTLALVEYPVFDDRLMPMADVMDTPPLNPVAFVVDFVKSESALYFLQLVDFTVGAALGIDAVAPPSWAVARASYIVWAFWPTGPRAFLVAWGAAVVFAVTMALLPKPPHVPIDQFGDKFEHMLAFATIALLAAFSYPQARLFRIGERLSFLGALIEVLQSIPSLHRDCDIHD